MSNSEIHCDFLVPDLQKEFGSLWACRPAGSCLEIQTPFSTATSKLVSVFLEVRNNEFIISDGGWIADDENPYDYVAFSDKDQEDGVIDYLLSQYKVKQTVALTGKRIFYTKTSKRELIASRVFDLAGFVSSCVTGFQLSIPLRTERAPIDSRFNTRATDFLKNRYENIQTNYRFPKIKAFSYHAVKMSDGKLSVATYVTGSNRYVFSGQISKGVVRMEMLKKSNYWSEIKTSVALLDNECEGYNSDEFGGLIDMISEYSTQPPISWTDREKLAEIF